MSSADPAFIASLQSVLDDAAALGVAEQQLTQALANVRTVQSALAEANATILDKDRALTASDGAIELLQSALSQARAEIERLQAIIDAGPTTPPTARFPGDPGVGKYRVGWSLERGTPSGWDLEEAMAQSWWNDKVSIIHDYARSSAKFLDRISAQLTIDKGFAVVSMSCKLGGITGTWTQKCQAILAGTHNAAIDSDIEWMKDRPDTAFWLCVYHEPEDLTAAEAKLLRDVTRYIAARAKAAGADNVAFTPIYQVPWSFGTDAGKTTPRMDFRIWHPDWKGTTTPANPAADWYTGDDAACAMFGGDVYDPLPPKAPAVTGNHNTFGQMWDTTFNAAAKVGLDPRPTHQGEFGMGRIKGTADQAPPEGWAQFCTDARDYAPTRNIVSFCYWDNSDDIGRYRLTNAAKLEGWNILCAGAVR